MYIWEKYKFIKEFNIWSIFDALKSFYRDLKSFIYNTKLLCYTCISPLKTIEIMKIRGYELTW